VAAAPVARGRGVAPGRVAGSVVVAAVATVVVRAARPAGKDIHEGLGLAPCGARP